MSKMYHIHVYKVTKKAEITILAKDEVEAQKEALDNRKKLNFGQSDCNYLAVSFEA